MSIEQTLLQRSGAKCELCASEENLTAYNLAPENEATSVEKSVLVCAACNSQIAQPDTMDANHWRCLNDSMWNPEPAVQVMAWRLLNKLSVTEPWAQNLLDTLYLEPEVLSWAESDAAASSDDDSEPTLDNNGSRLLAGDTVTLIKDLDVKGAGFTAKRGTLVKNITLTDNPKHIEGRVNGIRLVLVADFMKKVS